MDLKSLTYTSFASLDLDDDQLSHIHYTARDVNALEGVTGLLVFNGTHFLQIVEGSREAIDDLVVRLRRDPRHSGFEVRDEREIEKRSFPGWSMELVRVQSNYFEARSTIQDRLPASMEPAVRERLLRMTENISGIVHL